MSSSNLNKYFNISENSSKITFFYSINKDLFHDLNPFHYKIIYLLKYFCQKYTVLRWKFPNSYSENFEVFAFLLYETFCFLSEEIRL